MTHPTESHVCIHPRKWPLSYVHVTHRKAGDKGLPGLDKVRGGVDGGLWSAPQPRCRAWAQRERPVHEGAWSRLTLVALWPGVLEPVRDMPCLCSILSSPVLAPPGLTDRDSQALLKLDSRRDGLRRAGASPRHPELALELPLPLLPLSTSERSGARQLSRGPRSQSQLPVCWRVASHAGLPRSGS